ncbi:mitochondrial carrier domain-containing protein [Diplogelasinospora grovesii]|uniref:Mitochondrial carrier domain-containing protein n=1 Tax=Diplogelasinospora grovesii TaxID=303347 RepID=A0AAN6N714_9PEZI|nr:mitochondrial carrier domain-containing protein [Diplogelasinospora grovesii]
MQTPTTFLPALGHAASGAGGTVVSTLTTYPLDLVNTRLKVQRQLRRDGVLRSGDEYHGVVDAFSKIYHREGGISAFCAGLGPDVAKSAADSFLFFLFYTWFRNRRLQQHHKHLDALEELAVGAVAGACAKLFTTPVSNVVTRKQTASLLDSSANDGDSQKTFGEVLAEIRRERGVLGLWAGYSASLVLTLNPSITFFLQQMLERTALIPRLQTRNPEGATTTFLLAAISKVVATTVTYPFQIAKARVQVSGSAPTEKAVVTDDEDLISLAEEEHLDEKKPKAPAKKLVNGVRHVASDSIFGTVFRIARTEGAGALYDGIGGELLKAFLSHGTTMLAKDVIHRLIVRLYFAILAALQRYQPDVLRSRLTQRLSGFTGKPNHRPVPTPAPEATTPTPSTTEVQASPVVSAKATGPAPTETKSTAGTESTAGASEAHNSYGMTGADEGSPSTVGITTGGTRLSTIGMRPIRRPGKLSEDNVRRLGARRPRKVDDDGRSVVNMLERSQRMIDKRRG